MAAPLLERLIGNSEAFALAVTSGSGSIATERLAVTDCAKYAWRNADDKARCYQQLHPDFVFDYRAQLDEAALQLDESRTSMFSRVLTEVWAKRGYIVDLAEETDGEPFRYEQPRCPADDVFYAVWDEAAYCLDPYAVVREAGLEDELPRYGD